MLLAVEQSKNRDINIVKVQPDHTVDSVALPYDNTGSSGKQPCMFQVRQDLVPQFFALIRCLYGGIALRLFFEVIFVPVVGAPKAFGKRHIHAPSKLIAADGIIQDCTPKGQCRILRCPHKTCGTHGKYLCGTFFKRRIGHCRIRRYINNIRSMVALRRTVYRIGGIVNVKKIARLIGRSEKLVGLAKKCLHDKFCNKAMRWQLSRSIYCR